MRLAVSVVTCRHAPMRRPASGRSLREALADRAQDGHLALRPLDAPDALGGEAEIGDVVGRGAVGRVMVIVAGTPCVCANRRSADAMSAHSEPIRCPSRSSKRTCSAYPSRRYALSAGGLSERTLRTTWSQNSSSWAVTAAVVACA